MAKENREKYSQLYIFFDGTFPINPQRFEKAIIAIDGPAGAGKSSIGKKLADILGLKYLDTGSMYRLAAYVSLTSASAPQNAEELTLLLESKKIAIEQSPTGMELIVDGEAVNSLIRTPEMSKEASRIAVWTPLRRYLVTLQRRICSEGGFVVEGRDIGSVVFPHTPYKFYLDATVEERARRRREQLLEKKIEYPLESLCKEIEARDHNDKNRRDSPLCIAEGATYIDSTTLTIDEVLKKIISTLAEKETTHP